MRMASRTRIGLHLQVSRGHTCLQRIYHCPVSSPRPLIHREGPEDLAIYTVEIDADLTSGALDNSLARSARVRLSVDVDARDHLHAGAVAIEVATRLPLAADLVVDDVTAWPAPDPE